MSEKNNSFAENMRQVVVSQTNQLSALTAIQRSFTDNELFSTAEYEDPETGEVKSYQLPTYISMAHKIEAIQKSLDNLVSGRGNIVLGDGSRRQIKISTIPTPPSSVISITDPINFSIDSNWFFENLMYPGATVSIDLTGNVEESADRVRIKRIIIDSKNYAAELLWKNTLSINNYSYIQLISLLTENGIPYYEDEEDVAFPLVTNTFYGKFTITSDPEVINNKIYYILDNIKYGYVSDLGVNIDNNNIIAVGDRLQYEDKAIFKVAEIDQNSRRVRLILESGVATLSIGASLLFYQDPYKRKQINVRFGANEYNIIYVKPIAENYNLLANEWSGAIKFYSNELILDEDNTTTFEKFYNTAIVDWGANMIAEAKEKQIRAYHGKKPNTPSLVDSDFRVVQINTQINAALDTDEVKQLKSDIEEVKTTINNLISIISSQKNNLRNLTNFDEIEQQKKQIQQETNDLYTEQARYATLIANLKQIIKTNKAISTDPKYHVRGFFAIPALQYTNDEATKPEEIIGFEIAYRYIKEDNTGVALNTFEYSGLGGEMMTGIFSDWNFTATVYKERGYNEETGVYEWLSENTADGSEININQIDLPISKGEKLEFKVRSISEAGWPSNPLKSNWSNSVIIAFPSTLETDNEFENIFEEYNKEVIAVEINNAISVRGLDEHINDQLSSIKFANGAYSKHFATNIAYEKRNSTNNTEEIESVQNIIDYLVTETNNINNKISKNNYDISVNHSEIENLQQNVLDISIILHGKTGTDGVLRVIESLKKKIDYHDTFIKSIIRKMQFKVNASGEIDGKYIPYIVDISMAFGDINKRLYTIEQDNLDAHKQSIEISEDIEKHDKFIESLRDMMDISISRWGVVNRVGTIDKIKDISTVIDNLRKHIDENDGIH